MELEGQYDAKKVEDTIYKLWEDSGFFNPDNLPKRHKKPFSMVLPPPNVTGTLHIGHALTVTIEDIIIRYQRMLGKKTLWIPGTDHASIATETKFLKETGIRKSDYKERREEFINLVNEFALKNQSTIIKQLKAVGASLDWSRLKYTLGKEHTHAVEEAFMRMHPRKGAGVIYMGFGKVVNWDIKGQTAIDDQEVEYETGKTKLYTFRYSKDFPIAISTTRPETKVGDTAVAVHPKDKNYKQFIGKIYKDIKFAGVSLNLKIVGDPAVDPEFGTGAVGVTPAHSKIDEEIADRHGLKKIQVINGADQMNDNAGILKNLKVLDARIEMEKWLRDNNLLEKEPEEIEHNIPKSQRSGGRIEYLPHRDQFFVSVNKPIPEKNNKTLKDLMRDAVKSGKIKIIPRHFEKTYFNWLKNLRDWSISRQIWYGHRFPVLYKRRTELSDDNDLDYIVTREQPNEEYPEKMRDTLDTWFSSGLWTFSALGWPNPEEMKKNHFDLFHPTSVLETGYDILFFWIARMILMSAFLLEEVPFHTVYLHGLVRDAQGRKMSKSLGNVIDPLLMTEKYGTDALRFALAFGTAPGTDSTISEDKIKGMKNFANKIWNASKFVFMNIDGANLAAAKKTPYSAVQKKYLKEFAAVKKEVTKLMDSYKFYAAAETIYHYFWHTFCDTIIEESKPLLADPATKAATQKMLLEILEESLKMLHPFMPFITEEIWRSLPEHKELLMVESW